MRLPTSIVADTEQNAGLTRNCTVEPQRLRRNWKHVDSARVDASFFGEKTVQSGLRSSLDACYEESSSSQWTMERTRISSSVLRGKWTRVWLFARESMRAIRLQSKVSSLKTWARLRTQDQRRILYRSAAMIPCRLFSH